MGRESGKDTPRLNIITMVVDSVCTGEMLLTVLETSKFKFQSPLLVICAAAPSIEMIIKIITVFTGADLLNLGAT